MQVAAAARERPVAMERFRLLARPLKLALLDWDVSECLVPEKLCLGVEADDEDSPQVDPGGVDTILSWSTMVLSESLSPLPWLFC